MNCVRCGAKLKEGCLYCSVCGKEVQMVSDDGVLEDDYLRSLLKEENAEKKKGTAKPGGNGRRRKISGRTPVIIVGCVLAFLLLAAASVKVSIDRRNANSYEYQVEKAGQKAAEGDYEGAMDYYRTALSLRPSDTDVRMAMADLSMEQGEEDAAMVLLIEVIGLEPQNKEAYSSLIAIYEGRKDYDSILELASGVTDEEILGLFEEYFVDAPIISPAEGEYEDSLTVSMYSAEDFDIYYTINGADPDEEEGILYREEEKISIEEEGEYEIRAVCRNEKGILSDVALSSYTVVFTPPDFPTVTPDGGRISWATSIYITAEEGCDIYYTWDGQNPTWQSARYTGPLSVPVGNNILSVIAVSRKTGLDSGVYRANFIYYPE